ncbi:RNA-directed DNA polymerase [Bacillus fengqiuensis]|nr:RNA-directed DNA polymerase [Bacillus fengqiuensis]
MSYVTATPLASAASPRLDYENAPWVKLERNVRRLQQRIFRAETLGDKRKVRNLQRLLMRSKATLLLSIRQVTQINKGKRTAGVDGFKTTSKTERIKLIKKLEQYNIFMHKPSPARRVNIPKGNTGKLRPLGIPTMIDRVYQNVVKLALEPQWEQRFESVSYGFRPKRSAHDAVSAIWNKVHTRSKKHWIFEGDFKGCFDNLNHDYIMEQINNFPAKNLIYKWLKAGFVDNNVFHKTETGTPQGGIVSPLLANIALHGMEEEIGVKYRFKNLRKKGIVQPEITSSHSLVRYADDFVIMCESKEQAESMYEVLKPYLKKRGLTLAPDKTKVTHMSEGFDFLGFNFRHYPVNAERGRLWKLLVKSSKKSQDKFKDKIREIFKKHQGSNVSKLIGDLNPVIRGTANYWKSVSSKETFADMDTFVWQKTKRFLKRSHPLKSWKWIEKQYFHEDIHGQSKNKWLLTCPSRRHQLIKMSWTPIERHVIVFYKNTPFDSNLRDFYEQRSIKEFNSNNIASRQKLAKKQKHKCPLCTTSILTEEGLEVHHKTPRYHGGKDDYKNLALVHISCHILWHKAFPAKGKIPTLKMTKAFTKMLKKTKALI